MDNLEDSENAKISDSAYSNSCSNSQSRRSHSSKSTHSGSNSSGSSGYGGKPSTSSSSNNVGQPPKKEKEPKKKKLPQTDTMITAAEVEIESRPTEPILDLNVPMEVTHDVIPPPPPLLLPIQNTPEIMDICHDRKILTEEVVIAPIMTVINSAVEEIANQEMTTSSDEFSCVISIRDGVVMYTTSSLITALGYPKKMWIGRSFIDFIHPSDRSTFASQITNGLSVPKIINGTQEQVQSPANGISTMVCRIRKYRGLISGFGVKEIPTTYTPFLLKLNIKSFNAKDGKKTYLVIQASPFCSAFKTPHETNTKMMLPFVIRHKANGLIEYVDPESVPYLGYLPQDLTDKDALMLYHPDDLMYLQKVYESIVKEGGVLKSKPFRMLTQNGDYIKLVTEWTSFINPWSKKLEFVCGKHQIIEGPANPDVFQAPDSCKPLIFKEEDKNRLQMLRENMIRIMNEVLTKPAEAARQQMSKRCQDLAVFMESMMEESPKIDDDLRLEIQDGDNNYYIDQLSEERVAELRAHCVGLPRHDDTSPPSSQSSCNRCNTSQITAGLISPCVKKNTDLDFPHFAMERDSVMLGGISPHHEYNDSKSSTETPLSYTQLNYNDNMQRFFDNHEPYMNESDQPVDGENIFRYKYIEHSGKNCFSPMAEHSGDSDEWTGSWDSNMMAIDNNSPRPPSGDYQPVRLTEFLLSKHNAEMEKELVKIHRESRPCGKGEREKASIETRQKKKEHLARCNASFQPTAAACSSTSASSPVTNAHGVKRASKHIEAENNSHKHHCPSARTLRRKHRIATTKAPVGNAPNVTSTVTANQWTTPQVSNISPFVVGYPQQMSMMSPMTSTPGMYPVYYALPPPSGIPTTSTSTSTSTGYQPQQMPCMVYGQPMYGAPYMYPPTSYPHPQMPYPMPQPIMTQPMMSQPMMPPSMMPQPVMPPQMMPQAMMSPQMMPQIMMPQPMMPQPMPFPSNMSPLGYNSRNYEEACTRHATKRCGETSSAWRDTQQGESQEQSSKTKLDTSNSNTPKPLNRNSEPTPGPCRDTQVSPNKSNRQVQSDDMVEKTDGESSYSSFYSSFFKTESGSAEDSDAKKTDGVQNKKFKSPTSSYEPAQFKKVSKRKIDPPWLEQVCMTSELIYKYQISSKNMEDVLSEDRKRLSQIEQPSLVNEQLGQLYLDLQLEGVAAKLTLEDGITSSSSSGEETTTNIVKERRKKREYSKMGMIFEEDAPMPPPLSDTDEAEIEPQASGSSSTLNK